MPPREQGAPWVRTRLRAAPVATVAFGVLVLVTAFLAAVLPRAVEAYETDGLRAAVAGASPESTVLELKAVQPGLELPEKDRADEVLPKALKAVDGAARSLLPAPLRADPAESAYGVRTAKSLEAQEASLPRPDGLPPRFTLATQSGLAGHATVREGRLPAAKTPVTVDTRVVEGAVTAETARTLRLRTGSTLTLADFLDGPLTVRITGIVEPRHPQRSYWSAEPVLRTPGLTSTGSRLPMFYWEAGVLAGAGGRAGAARRAGRAGEVLAVRARDRAAHRVGHLGARRGGRLPGGRARAGADARGRRSDGPGVHRPGADRRLLHPDP
ncbi:hypothetical protein SPURM210S_03368 [Streptomyces purpurascens]